MLDPVRVDFAIDLAYGALILLAIVLIATLDFGVGIAYGVGAFAGYLLHVIWKMARFDPEWMTAEVEARVAETVEERMEEAVGEQLADVQAQVEEVDERIGRRPREEDLEELIEEVRDPADGSAGND